MKAAEAWAPVRMVGTLAVGLSRFPLISTTELHSPRLTAAAAHAVRGMSGCLADAYLRTRKPSHQCLQLALEEDPVLLESFGYFGSLIGRSLEEPTRAIQTLRGGHETTRVEPDDPRLSPARIFEQSVEYG